MKLSVAILSLAILSGGNASFAQTDKQDKKAKAYMVADAHLDTQWNWDIQTTIKEYVWNTLSQNLFLLKRYPDYVFNFEGGVKYAWMKEYYPAQYEEMKEYIRNGRWHISGSSWDATDVLVPSTESFIRNILLGQEYYRKEFGVESTDIFLPDCFGFGWTLPTIAAHCGLIGFSSQKLDWRNHPFYGKSKHPFMIGLWKGVDGTSIMQGVAVVFIAQAYGIPLTPAAIATVIATATIASIGTAGVPSVGLVTLSMVLTSVGLPTEGIALIMGIDRILDMLRTAVNITGDAVCTTIVAKQQGAFNENTFRADN